MCNFWAKKWPICLEQIFFDTSHFYYFHLPVGPFHCAKFRKSCEDAAFWAQIGHFSLMGTFSKKSCSVTCNYIWTTNSMLSLRKKITSQFRQNIQKDGRMDRHILFSGQGRGSKKSPVKNRTACKY